ncbi:MAG: hypothetical protein H0T45_02425, partial [Pyrinomonadaceae bacterium]|nr:hypothetical protein [Pyrinomonadaceae bacterium]
MSRLSRFPLAAVCLLAASFPFNAQVANKNKQPAGGGKNTAASAGAATDPLAAERRMTAVSLVNALADEARGFRDPNLKARVQAQAANALWETDRERAVALFRRAWDAAEAADQENQRRREAVRNTQGSGGPRLATNLNLPNMRGEVLRLAAKRDRALGEQFLGELEETRKQEEKDAATAAAGGTGTGTNAATTTGEGGERGRDVLATPPEAARRLRLALQFLNDGEVERALQFAEPALGQPHQLTVEFLVVLREKDAAAADQRYVALLSRAAIDPSTDANTILMLSSYVLTPHLYMAFERGGGISSSQRRRDITRPDLPAPVRSAFANVATQIFLRPVPPPDQDQTTTGREGLYFVIARLLPFIEQIDPNKGSALRAQMAALAPDLRARDRDFERDLTRGLVPETEDSQAGIQEALDQASKATDPERRNGLYAAAAMRAARGNDSQAEDIAAKIEDIELRRQVRAFVQFVRINQAVEKKDGAEVLRLVANASEITRAQRTWGYTEAGRLLLKPDRTRALEALEAAAAEARRIDAEDADRVSSTVAVATQFFELDRGRAWEIMAEAVKASNGAVEYTGADSGLAVRVQ